MGGINNLDAVHKLWESEREYIDKFNRVTGENLTVSKWTTLENWYDVLYCQHDYFGDPFQWPDWFGQMGQSAEVTMDHLKRFRDLQFQLYGLLGEEFLRLKAGPFIKELVTVLKQTDPSSTNGRVYTYGTHDNVLAMILNAILGEFKGILK